MIDPVRRKRKEKMADRTGAANVRNRTPEKGTDPAGQAVKEESGAGGQAVKTESAGAGQAAKTESGASGAAGQAANTASDAAGHAGQKVSSQGDNKLIRLLTSEGMRYLFIGGCTTMVNLLVYAVLCRVVHLNVNISNIISVSVSILFAYVTNKLIVFRSHCSSIGELAAECARFIGARLATMVIEVGGVFVLYEILHQNEMVAKLATQVLVVIGNYFISRFIVFKDRT